MTGMFWVAKFPRAIFYKFLNCNIGNQRQLMSTTILAKIFHKLYFFCEIATYGKSSISIFHEFFASIDKILILGARLSTRV